LRYVILGMVQLGVVLVALLVLDEAALAGGAFLTASLPELGLVLLGAQRLMPEIQKLYQSASTMRFGLAAVESVHADMMLGEDRPDLRAGRKAAPIPLAESLALRGVSFRYPSGEGPALADITLEIARGQKIGIVGTTGAGKSTLADVVLGLLRPDSGQVEIDGRALADEDIPGWQKVIGYVPQHIFLADTTIAQNIALGEMPDRIDWARIEEAARIAQLHDFVVSQLPQGYDTRVGERGVRLSGGQRQRIGIARALYKRSELIVFDEATSALDTLTEEALVDAIEALPQDRTMLVIAHRLSTVRSCDRIVVMERGRILAAGSWEDNLRDCPAFSNLVAAMG